MAARVLARNHKRQRDLIELTCDSRKCDYFVCTATTILRTPPGKKSSSSRYNFAHGTRDTTISNSCNLPPSDTCLERAFAPVAGCSVMARLTGIRNEKVAKASVYLLVPMFPANMLFHRKILRPVSAGLLRSQSYRK